MKTYYVSLTRDLIGCYLAFHADSEEAVRLYLSNHYLEKGVWKLPWCAIYDKVPDVDKNPTIIQSKELIFLEDQQ